MEPLILATWKWGGVGAEEGYRRLCAGESALDAGVAAATLVEDDPRVDSVGTGGMPDADGRVSLDACVMTDPDRCGSVAFIRRYPNPTQIARRVMEKTIHVMLVGDGAEEFAEREGFEPRPVLTDAAREKWEEWRRKADAFDRSPYTGWIPPANVEEAGVDPEPGEPSGHDTVSILTLDQEGTLAGVCSTSGMAFKVPGRVGDSPIIGQGLYVDQRAGAAAATGTGELIMGVCASFLVVELMRAGAEPEAACMEVLRRIEERYSIKKEHQVALIAMTPRGEWASCALREGFHHTVVDGGGMRVEKPGRVVMD